MTPENPPLPASAPVVRLLESALAGLECGADDDELTEALRLLGQSIDAPPSHDMIERLFCVALGPSGVQAPLLATLTSASAAAGVAGRAWGKNRPKVG